MVEKLKCEYSGCPWVSPEGDLATVVKLMEMHFTANHKPDQTSKGNSSKVEKAKRPEISAEMSDEDWAAVRSSGKIITGTSQLQVPTFQKACFCPKLSKLP